MALTGQAKTDYQREYMRRHRRAKLERSAGLVRSKRLPEDEQTEPPEQQDQELIERLMQVTRERDQLRKELELVIHRGAECSRTHDLMTNFLSAMNASARCTSGATRSSPRNVTGDWPSLHQAPIGGRQ